ncbi:MAG: hypothetical protein AAB071_06820, partial [Bacteroidota bacterium]
MILDDFRIANNDTRINPYLVTIELIDAHTKQILATVHKIMLQDVVEWNVSDSAIDNNFTMSLTGFENKEVLVRTRLLGQREKLQEPAWTEIILGNEQQSSAKI